MAKQYQVTQSRRLENALVSGLVRLGIGPGGWPLVATEGRVTGQIRETPIDPIELDGKRFLVAPFGVVNWVKNACETGRVQLRRGAKVEFLEVREADPVESAPVLRAYLRRGYTEDYFDSNPDSPLAEFEAQASDHPVFEVVGSVPPFA